MAKLQRISFDNGVVALQSPQFLESGLVHGFSTRLGGVSKGPYASLNLGTLDKNSPGDTNTVVAENFRRWREALECPRMPRVVVRQVHGSGVWVPPTELVHVSDAPQADAMVSDRPEKMLTVRVADCVPVLLAGSDEFGTVRAVGAVHAGWRGIIAGVVPAAVEAMKINFDLGPEALMAAVGPHIGLEHFEVGPEVTAAFEAAGLGEAVRRGGWARPHIDLGRAVVMQLRRAGVAAGRIDVDEYCTYRDSDLFYSYRRDGECTGRMAAVIAMRSEYQ